MGVLAGCDPHEAPRTPGTISDGRPGLRLRPYSGVIALIPVAARPMISFWICEVPS